MKMLFNPVFVLAVIFGTLCSAIDFCRGAETAGNIPTKRFDKISDFDIQADKSEYQFDTEWAKLSGNVAIRYSDIELRADTVRFNRVTGDAEAQGNVVFFSTTGDVWQGETLKVNMFSGMAYSSKFDFYSKPVRVIANKGSVYTTPEKKKEYILENAIVTTCTNDVCKFHYKIKAKKLCVRPDDEFVAQGVVSYLFGIPFFYWPYYWKDLNRHYGFRFEPGYSSDWGAFLLSSYKMSLYRNKETGTFIDAKTSIDYRSERGFAYGEKLLWNRVDRYDGWLSLYYLDDEYDKLEKQGIEDTERYRIRLNNEWNVTPRDRFLAQAIYVSDDRFMKDFFEEEYDEEVLGELNVYDQICKQPNRKGCALIPVRAIDKVLEVFGYGNK